MVIKIIKEVIMKTQTDLLISRLPGKIFLAMAVMVTLCIAIDSALNASHIMVFFSLIILSILFITIYIESEKHKLGVTISCLIIGSLYLILNLVDFIWWRFIFYSGALYISAILFFTSWLITRHWHHTHQ